ncbi:type II toxin-antitoxin system HipA family toxin [Sulfurovum lithotrophicum]|nr:type II toxin-antitoxin system HipA family toxin [Sulfurovum lithotrophicum]
MSSVVEVKLWGTTIGYLGYKDDSNIAHFEYTEAFMKAPVYISPLVMKHPPAKHYFDAISFRTFKGVAGVFADSLPDKFGNQLIDQFMAKKQIVASDVTTLDRLLYIGNRGMGAIEYHPYALDNSNTEQMALDLTTLAELAQMVVENKEVLQSKLNNAQTREDALSLIRVGSSAGGARSKALVVQKEDGKLYDGTLLYDEPCTYWLLKFDSLGNRDRDHEDPKGMTKVEYIYSLIAKACDIEIPRTNYIQSGDDFHFMIERFDRQYNDEKSSKLHYVSWAGLAHFDRDTTGAYSYEQLVLTVRSMNLGQGAVTEVFKRAVFNIVGRNQDDHTKNFGFLMDKSGRWRLSPAFDLTYSYDPTGKWTKVHQLKLNNKQDNFSREDIIAFGRYCNLSKAKSIEILKSTQAHFASFDTLAQEYGVDDGLREMILQSLRFGLYL